jgi:hypothetical protein
MQQRFTHSGSIYEDAHTVGDVARRRNVPITKRHGATFYKMLDLKGGMYHATSGRRDNDNLGDDSPSLTEVSHLLELVARAVQQQIAAYQDFWNAGPNYIAQIAAYQDFWNAGPNYIVCMKRLHKSIVWGFRAAFAKPGFKCLRSSTVMAQPLFVTPNSCRSC